MSAMATPLAGFAKGPARVVRVVARLNVGGIARHVTWLTAGLKDLGYPTLLVTGTVPTGEDDMSYFAAQHDVHPLVIPEMSREISPKDLLTVWKLYRQLVRVRPEIVHTHSAKAGTAGRLAVLLYRWLTPGTLLGRPRPCRVVHTFHGHIFHSYYTPLTTRLFVTIEKVLARLATDRIVVISPQQYREIHEQFGVGCAGQFAVIRLGLELETFRDWAERRPIVCAELGARDQDLLVGIVGRLTKIKNHHLFLQAVAAFKNGQSARPARRVRFLVIGDGQLRPDLEEQSRALGLSEDVRFLGTRADPQNFYPALDAVALTSLNEGTPLTLIEAMANARPVIATAVGGVVDLLGEGPCPSPTNGPGYTVCRHGLLVRPRDAQAFARGLGRLLEDDDERRVMGDRGRCFVETYYAKERLLADVKRLYDNLLSRRLALDSKRESARPAQASFAHL